MWEAKENPVFWWWWWWWWYSLFLICWQTNSYQSRRGLSNATPFSRLTLLLGLRIVARRMEEDASAPVFVLRIPAGYAAKQPSYWPLRPGGYFVRPTADVFFPDCLRKMIVVSRNLYEKMNEIRKEMNCQCTRINIFTRWCKRELIKNYTKINWCTEQTTDEWLHRIAIIRHHHTKLTWNNNNGTFTLPSFADRFVIL